MKYKVFVMERWERAVEIEADSPEKALELVHELHSGADSPVEMYIHEPTYVEDEPKEDWEVYEIRKMGMKIKIHAKNY